MATFLGYLAVLAVTTILGRLLQPRIPRPKQQELDIPLAEEGGPIPLVLGTGSVVPNVILTSDRESETGSDGYTSYWARVGLGLCLGEIHKIQDIQFDGRSLRLEPYTKKQSRNQIGYVVSENFPWDNVGGAPKTIYASALNMFGGEKEQGGIAGVIRVHWGTLDDEIDPLFAHVLADKASRYPGVAYMTFGADPNTVWPYEQSDGHFHWRNNNPHPPSVQVLVTCIPHALLGSVEDSAIGHNANPAEMIYALMTNDWWGVELPRPDTINVTSFYNSALQLKLEREGLSMTLTGQQSIEEIIEDICQHIDAMVYPDPETNEVTMTLIRPDYVLGDLDTVDEAIYGKSFSVKRAGYRRTINDLHVNYSRLNLGEFGWKIGEVLTSDLRFNGMGLFASFQVEGRNISDLVVYADGVDVTVSSVKITSAAAGTFILFNTADTTTGQTITVDYFGSPTTMGFEEASAQWQNLANWQATGQFRSEKMEFPFVTDPILAARIAARKGKILSTPLDQYTWESSRKSHSHKPGGVVRLQNVKEAIDMPVRIVDVAISEFHHDKMVFTGVEDIFGEDIMSYPNIPGSDGGFNLIAPPLTISCGSGGPGVVRINLHPTDPNFNVEIWWASDADGTGATRITPLTGHPYDVALPFFDHDVNPATGLAWVAGESGFYRARLTQIGNWEPGPWTTPWHQCFASNDPAEVPLCTEPTYDFVPSAMGTLGTVTLIINDPQNRVTGVRYKKKSGNGGWTDWTDAPESLLLTVTLVSDQSSQLEWEIAYIDCNGDDAVMLGAFDFPTIGMVDQFPMVLNLPGATGITAAAVGAGSIRLEWSEDGSTGWDSLDGTTGPEIPFTSTGLIKSSGWSGISSTAKAAKDIALRLAYYDAGGVFVSAVGLGAQVWKVITPFNFARLSGYIELAGGGGIDPVYHACYVEFVEAIPVEELPDPVLYVDGFEETFWGQAKYDLGVTYSGMIYQGFGWQKTGDGYAGIYAASGIDPQFVGRYVDGQAHRTLGFHLWIRPYELSATGMLLGIWDGIATDRDGTGCVRQVELWITTDGYLQLRSDGVILATDVTPIGTIGGIGDPSEYIHLFVRLVIDAANGGVEVLKNGAAFWTSLGHDTMPGNAGATEPSLWVLGMPDAVADDFAVDVDDLVITDGTYIGMVDCPLLSVDGEGDLQELTYGGFVSYGTWQNVRDHLIDDASMDEFATYAEGLGDGLFSLTNPAVSGDIKAVAVVPWTAAKSLYILINGSPDLEDCLSAHQSEAIVYWNESLQDVTLEPTLPPAFSWTDGTPNASNPQISHQCGWMKIQWLGPGGDADKVRLDFGCSIGVDTTRYHPNAAGYDPVLGPEVPTGSRGFPGAVPKDYTEGPGNHDQEFICNFMYIETSATSPYLRVSYGVIYSEPDNGCPIKRHYWLNRVSVTAGGCVACATPTDPEDWSGGAPTFPGTDYWAYGTREATMSPIIKTGGVVFAADPVVVLDERTYPVGPNRTGDQGYRDEIVVFNRNPVTSNTWEFAELADLQAGVRGIGGIPRLTSLYVYAVRLLP